MAAAVCFSRCSLKSSSLASIRRSWLIALRLHPCDVPMVRCHLHCCCDWYERRACCLRWSGEWCQQWFWSMLQNHMCMLTWLSGQSYTLIILIMCGAASLNSSHERFSSQMIASALGSLTAAAGTQVCAPLASGSMMSASGSAISTAALVSLKPLLVK